MSFQRTRRALALRPVSSLKHVVDITTALVGTGQIVTDLAIQKDSPSTSSVNQVHTGSHIKAIFLNVQAILTVTVTTGFPSIYFYILKNPSNEIVPLNMAGDTVGSNQRRKFVIHQEMLMLSKNSADNFPRTMFKGVIKLPQRYQRFGDEDRLQIVAQFSGTVDGGATAQFCIQCIYKEFF